MTIEPTAVAPAVGEAVPAIAGYTIDAGAATVQAVPLPDQRAPAPAVAAYDPPEKERPPVEASTTSVNATTQRFPVIAAPAATADGPASAAARKAVPTLKPPSLKPRSHMHRCGRCGHPSRHTGTCAISTVTDLLPCPVCEAASARPRRTRRALVAAAVAGLALVPALWWLDAIPRPSDRMAQVLSDLRESVDAGDWPVAFDGGRTGAGSAPASSPVEAPRLHPRVARRSRSPRRSIGCHRARRRPRASTRKCRRLPPLPPRALKPRPRRRRRVSRSGRRRHPQPCRFRQRTEMPRRSPPPDPKVAESPRARPGVPAGNAPSGVIAAPPVGPSPRPLRQGPLSRGPPRAPRSARRRRPQHP